MVRLPRFIFPSFPQHIIIRGNNRQPIFHIRIKVSVKLGEVQSDPIDLISP